MHRCTHGPRTPALCFATWFPCYHLKTTHHRPFAQGAASRGRRKRQLATPDSRQTLPSHESQCGRRSWDVPSRTKQPATVSTPLHPLMELVQWRRGVVPRQQRRLVGCLHRAECCWSTQHSVGSDASQHSTPEYKYGHGYRSPSVVTIHPSWAWITTRVPGVPTSDMYWPTTHRPAT